MRLKSIQFRHTASHEDRREFWRWIHDNNKIYDTKTHKMTGRVQIIWW